MDVKNFSVLIGVAVLLPSMAAAVPFTTTTNFAEGSSSSAESIFSNGRTSSIGFNGPTSTVSNTTLSFARGLDVPIVATFGGLTQGQTIGNLSNANNDGGNVTAINTSGGVAGGNFNFDQSTYTRNSSGRYGSVGVVPTDQAYVSGSSGPVAIAADNSMSGAAILQGYGFVDNRAVGGTSTLRGGFGAITVVFDELVSGFGGYVGSLSNSGSVRLVVFGDDGAVLAEVSSTRDENVSNAGLGAFDLLAVEDDAEENIIRGATFYQQLGDESGFALDYVVFERARGTSLPPGAVPVPASLLLMMFGFAGLLIRKRIS